MLTFISKSKPAPLTDRQISNLWWTNQRRGDNDALNVHRRYTKNPDLVQGRDPGWYWASTIARQRDMASEGLNYYDRVAIIHGKDLTNYGG